MVAGWVHPFDKESNEGLSSWSQRIPKLERSLGKARARHGSFSCLQCFKETFQRREEADLRKNRRKTGEGRTREGKTGEGGTRRRG